MDQMPIAYSSHASKTLEVKGKKKIHARELTADTKRVTLAALSLQWKHATTFSYFQR
jgi:hypothetical protein